jgi:formylmethanofuran dehydrogenase subunit B
MKALVNGVAVSVETAAEEAARLLTRSRQPIFAGLATDIAGARATVALAEKLRGAYDHIHSETVFRDLDVMRQAGLMITTPNEARLRADVLLFVGPKLTDAWPDMLERLDLASAAKCDTAQAPRMKIWLGPGRKDPVEASSLVFAATAAGLPNVVAALRALVAGKKIRMADAAQTKLTEIAKHLWAARFGVVVWSAGSIDSLVIEMLYGLIDDLNQTTRFSGLPLAASMNAMGVLQTSGWMTGFPMRTGFGRGYPEHDVWRFESNRMIESGEADAAVWISSYESGAPVWKRRVPLVALATPKTRFPYPPDVLIEVGAPGIDHDGVEYVADTGTLVMVEAKQRSDAPRIDQMIGLIDSYIENGDYAC